MKVGYIDHMGNDETPVKRARASYEGDTKIYSEEDNNKLLDRLMKEQHLGVLEGNILTVMIEASAPITQQIMRHRTFCISGDTEITFNRPDRWKKGIHTKQSSYKKGGFTVKELYRKWSLNSNSKNNIKNMLLRNYKEDEKKFGIASINDIIYTGIKDVFELELENGYKIKTTKDHKFLTLNGWQKLEDAIGLKIVSGKAGYTKEESFLTNGTEKPHQSYDWMKQQRELGLDVQKIADKAGCSYHNIRRWLKIHKLQFNHLDNLTGTNGKPAWNKGLRGYKINPPKNKNIIRNIKKGSDCHFWRGGITKERALIGAWTTSISKTIHEKNNYKCTKCGGNSRLETHHIIPVVEDISKAYDLDNLTTLCHNCHKEVHKQLGTYSDKRNNKDIKGLFGRYFKIKKITYIGKEETYDISVDNENHNFVGNGFVIHNCYNARSRRYLSDEHTPFTFDIPQVRGDKGKEANISQAEYEEFMNEFNQHCVRVYNQLVQEHGVAKEIARYVIPQGMNSRFYMTGNLRNWFHFLTLRMDSHAQKEVRDIANEVYLIIQEKYPKILAAYTKYATKKLTNNILGE